MATSTYTKRSFARDQFAIDSIILFFGVFLITYQFWLWLGVVVIATSCAKFVKSIIDISNFEE